MSLGTIFVFNSIALLVFPLIAVFFHLTEAQFGLWAALAIHDTSSVVGAGAHYGPTALVIAQPQSSWHALFGLLRWLLLPRPLSTTARGFRFRGSFCSSAWLP